MNSDFELVYLSLLTKEGIKPVSRWEKEFNRVTEQRLQAFGLNTRVVARTVLSGAEVRELLFSASASALETYSDRFDHRPLARNSDDVGFEGLLFGYPRCCVESFVTRGYVKNALRRRDQRILFHWACPRCAITPLILPDYWRVYRMCRSAGRARAWHRISQLAHRLRPRRLRPSVAMAMWLAALGLTGSAASAPILSPLSEHFISEPPGTDADRDGLRDWEEPAFETDPLDSDTDDNQLSDGSDTARQFLSRINALPAVSRREDGPKDLPFAVKQTMFGLETCPCCGKNWPMGLWEIINPVTGDAITVPTMALHYLEHGGFGWEGGQLLGGKGRVDPRQLQAVLTGKPNGHLLTVTPDQDGDYLSDQEEQTLAQNPTQPDQDQNAVLDGLDLARLLVCEIAGLPATPSSNLVFRSEFPLRGLERCDVCGADVNMGHLTVTNPQAHLSVDVPYIALHYLEHDSLSFAGDVHAQGRTDVKSLLEALFRPTVTITKQGQQVTVRWMTKTGRQYQLLTAPDLRGPWNPGPVLQGDDTQKVFTDTKPADQVAAFYKVTVR